MGCNLSSELTKEKYNIISSNYKKESIKNFYENIKNLNAFENIIKPLEVNNIKIPNKVIIYYINSFFLSLRRFPAPCILHNRANNGTMLLTEVIKQIKECDDSNHKLTCCDIEKDKIIKLMNIINNNYNNSEIISFNEINNRKINYLEGFNEDMIIIFGKISVNHYNKLTKESTLVSTINNFNDITENEINNIIDRVDIYANQQISHNKSKILIILDGCWFKNNSLLQLIINLKAKNFYNIKKLDKEQKYKAEAIAAVKLFNAEENILNIVLSGNKVDRQVTLLTS